MNLIYEIGTDWSTIMKTRKRETKKKSQSVGRPREFIEEDVLDNVMSLFWKQGYEGTGLSHILAATGLAKGSLYKAFQSKHNLYLKSLERYEVVHVDAAVKALRSNESPIKRLDDFLSAPINDALTGRENKGCFLCNASADRADIDIETSQHVKRSFKKLGQALSLVVSDIKLDWTKDQIDQAAQMLLSVYSGLRIMSRSGVDIDTLKASKAGALSLIVNDT